MTEGTLRVPSQFEIRDELERLMLADVLGPAGGPEEEVAESRVSERYLVGMLAPRLVSTPAETSDAVAVSGSSPTEEGEAEPEAPSVATLFPSSCGMTFTVIHEADELAVTATWGRYERRHSEIADEESGPRMVWKRIPCGGTITLPLRPGDVDSTVIDPDQPDVVLEGRIRSTDHEHIVTLFLVNRQEEPKTNRDKAWVFQVELSAAAQDRTAVFRRRGYGTGEPPGSDDAMEQRMLDMAYRDQVEFVVGHGIGVTADVDDADPRRAVRVATAVVPAYEVPATAPPTADDVPELAAVTLDMVTLANTATADLPGALLPLVDAYESWIHGQRARIGDPEARLDDHEDVAGVALDRCVEAAQRIRAGIDVLRDDEQAADAFRFANRAMALQRLHGLAAAERRRNPETSFDDALAAVDELENRSWRPFQLAFVLLNLPSLTDPAHAERGEPGLVDLLWFPTGGGKTEAYLGLTAYVLGMRRLQGSVAEHDGRDGVAVIMRYTLRLLTAQQFQRAAALLCACEVIRREAADDGDTRWGSTPFRIGLWVGMKATPNRTDDADQWVKQRRGASGYARGQGGSPAQLTACPWCGCDVRETADIVVDADSRRTLLFCSDKTGRCPFTPRRSPREGLPVVVVDEEMYRLLPALLIGTVDKFAQLPWNGAVGSLFGRVSRRCERHGFRFPDDGDADSHPKRGHYPRAKTVDVSPLRPPDLIIQDELHLIEGPLGSMVGLYETAIDRLCTWQLNGRTVRPKVIASTATVRRARHQAHALFRRDLQVFPPPGLDAGDSFFAVQRPSTSETPGRRYLGVCAHGRRFKAVLIRIYVAQLAAAQFLFEKYGGAVDPYMTLVGYFNSLRELGGMRRLVDDDVASRLRDTDERGLAKRRLGATEELTSRVGSGSIPRTLDRLGVRFQRDSDKDAARPIDVLLATNMVSVGVDVPRLGTMVVAGQPKATAEYIQATSRVGRQSPGLVVTVYNWARPRDLSHYETHPHYHATFYKHVEALSVTPFAPRALDRGLTALLVSLTRQEHEQWRPDEAAQRVDTASADIDEVVEAICERAAAVTAHAANEAEVEKALSHRLDAWANEQAIKNRRLTYRKGGDGTRKALLTAPGIEPWDTWTVLTSLRDVEPGIRLLLAQGDLGEYQAPPFERAAHDDVDTAS